jgi:ABC-2 type transport system permease protein
MLAIFWQTIRRKKISLLVYCLAGILFLWMFVAFFPSIQEEAEKFEEVFKSYPEEFMKALNIEELKFDQLEKFLTVEQFSIIWPIMVIFMIVAVAGAALSREVEKGTIEILLSRPVSRLKIFFARYLAGLFILLIFTVFSIFAVVPLAKLHDVDYVFKNYITIAVLGFLFGWAVFSMALMFSAIFSERSKVYMVSGSILFIMYALNVAASLRENLEELKYLSFFYYYDYSQALIHNTLENTSLLVFGGTVVVCTIIGAVWFNRRDVAV